MLSKLTWKVLIERDICVNFYVIVGTGRSKIGLLTRYMKIQNPYREQKYKHKPKKIMLISLLEPEICLFKNGSHSDVFGHFMQIS